MCARHTTSVMCAKGCNMCKLSYAPLLSSLISFCETLCYLNGSSLYVIENDSFQRQKCYALNKR